MRILIRDACDNECTIVEAVEFYKYTGPEESCIIIQMLDADYRYECYDRELLVPSSYELSKAHMELLKNGYVDLSNYRWKCVWNDGEEEE